jgi:hypothetical protein
MTNEGEVYFALKGESFDPDEITRLVGIEPTSIVRRGNPRPTYSSWKLSSGKIENDLIDIYEMSSAIISRLQPSIEKIITAKQQFKLTAILQVVLRITADNSISTPAIGFDAKVISFLSAVGASIDIDTYRNEP